MNPHEQLDQPYDYAPIPEPAELAGWKEVPIHETELSHEPLVAVGIFSDYRNIFSSSVYADEHHNAPYPGGLDGSNIAVFMREGVANRLSAAAEMLPRGHHLMVMDAYRTLEVQEALYEQYEQGLRAKHPGWTDEQLSTETQKYVSVPSHDETRPSPHNTGASVDVVIIGVPEAVQQQLDEIDSRLDQLDTENWQDAYKLEMERSELLRGNGKMLNFGTRFDHGGERAALRYFEEKAAGGELTAEEQDALTSRRMLYDVMTKAGMVPLESEWWHYNDPASQMGAKVSGREFAEYGAVQMSQANQNHAQIRKQHHINSVRLSRGEEWTPPEGYESHYEISKAAVRTSNPKNVWRMTDTVDKIEPPKDDIAA